MEVRLCECGCGQPTPIAKYTATARGWTKGQPIRFVQGHNSFGVKRGPGRIKNAEGYVKLHMPSHPSAHGGRYVLEHRLVMEAAIGRYLQTWEVVHHKNGVKDDNRAENLELMTRASHVEEHAPWEGRGVWCSIDGCDRKHFGRGYCSAHWKKWRKYGNPLAGVNQPQSGCTVDACSERGYSKGYCQYHYQRHLNGKPLVAR